MYSFQHFQYTIIATINDVKFYVTIAPVNELTKVAKRAKSNRAISPLQRNQSPKEFGILK